MDLGRSGSAHSSLVSNRQQVAGLCAEAERTTSLSAIYLYSIADSKSTQVTDGMSDARYPVFDKDGKYLYFTASTDSGASLQPDIHSFTRPVSRSIYLLVLSKDDPSPLAPESDEEKGEDKEPETSGQKQETASGQTEEKTQKPESEKTESKPREADKQKPVTVKIDFENIDQRILALPMPARRYVSLQIGKAGVLYALEGPAFSPGVEFILTVHRHDLKSRKSDVPLAGVRNFEISQNGEKLLYRQGDRWIIAAPKPLPPASGEAPPSPPTPPGGPTPVY